MNTIERTLIYDSLYLVNNDLDSIKEYQLPDGFKFVFFNDGDEMKDFIFIIGPSGVGKNFDIKYNGKKVLNGNPKSPSVYKITYNNNKEVINVSLVK